MESKNTDGQVFVDYLLTLALTITIVTIMAAGFKSGLQSLWQKVAQEVSAACPGCPPDPKIILRR